MGKKNNVRSILNAEVEAIKIKINGLMKDVESIRNNSYLDGYNDGYDVGEDNAECNN